MQDTMIQEINTLLESYKKADQSQKAVIMERMRKITDKPNKTDKAIEASIEALSVMIVDRVNVLSAEFDASGNERKIEIIDELKTISRDSGTPFTALDTVRNELNARMFEWVFGNDRKRSGRKRKRKNKAFNLYKLTAWIDLLRLKLKNPKRFYDYTRNAGAGITSWDKFKSNRAVIKADAKLKVYMNIIRRLGYAECRCAANTLIQTALDAPLPYIYHTVCVALGRIANKPAKKWLLAFYNSPLPGYKNEALLGSIIGLCMIYKKESDNAALKEAIIDIREYKKVNVSHLVCHIDPEKEKAMLEEAIGEVFSGTSFC